MSKEKKSREPEPKVKTYPFEKIVDKLKEKWDNDKIGTAIKVVEDTESGIRLTVAVLKSQTTDRKYVGFVVKGLASGRELVILPQDVMDLIMFFRRFDNEAIKLVGDLSELIQSEYSIRRRRVTEEEVPEGE